MRFDVKVVLTIEHTLVVEAPDAQEAQAKAMADMADRPPERMDTAVHVERGVR